MFNPFRIQSMMPVLKDFMWYSFELENQVRNMRDRLARFEKAVEPSQAVTEAAPVPAKVVEPSQPVTEAAAVPARKAIDQNAGNIFIRPGQTTIGVIGGKLSSLLTETNNNDLALGASS